VVVADDDARAAFRDARSLLPLADINDILFHPENDPRRAPCHVERRRPIPRVGEKPRDAICFFEGEIEVAALGPDYPVRADDRSFANIPCSTLSTSQHSLLRGREGKREREREE